MSAEPDVEDECQTYSAERGAAIRHEIAHRIGGRIRNFEIELSEDLIVIRGIVHRYYLKQLVLQAVVDLIGPATAPRIELNVQVLRSGRNPIDGQ
jgi:hypothetical protein